MDITSRTREQHGLKTIHDLHSTTPGSVFLSPGGVGRNIAEAAHRILFKNSSSRTPVLVSLVGKDIIGRVLQDELSQMGMRIDGLVLDTEKASAVCNMVIDAGGGLITGVADMHIIESLESGVVRFFCPSQIDHTEYLFYLGYRAVESVQPKFCCDRW